MARHDHRHAPHQGNAGNWPSPRREEQMEQYAGQNRRAQPRDARDWQDQRGGSDLERHDPAQVSYGRAGAPDVHGAPSGGYQRDWRADPGYNAPGYTRDPGYEGWDSADDDWRARTWRDERMGRQIHDHERYQGGSGGYRSNSGPYAGTHGYGGHGDQLGYGSGPSDQQQHRQGHADPDYLQWREQQLRNLDEDYRSWRGERYKKFSDEFDTWRRNRQNAASLNDLPGSADKAPDDAGRK